MSASNKSQRAFLAVTLMTVLAITMVFFVYAVILQTYYGGNVTITSIGGSIEYATTNSTGASWGGTLTQGAAAQWYARIAISGSPEQLVTVAWTLQKDVSGSWENQTSSVPTTSIQLSTSTTYIYASSNGLINSNYNFGQDTATQGTFRVIARVTG